MRGAISSYVASAHRNAAARYHAQRCADSLYNAGRFGYVVLPEIRRWACVSKLVNDYNQKESLTYHLLQLGYS